MPAERSLRRLRQWGVAALLSVLAGGAAAQAAAANPRLQLCMACHGPQGSTVNPQVPSLAGQPRVFLENQLVLIRDGVRDIPEMRGTLEKVEDAELVQMATYFAAQQPVAPPRGPADAAKVARGQQLSQQMLCASCHRPAYVGGDQVPRLKDQPEPFLLASMKQFRDKPGLGRDTIMAATLRGTTDAQLSDLAHYLAQLR